MSVSSVLCVVSHCCQIPHWKINIMWFKSELHLTTFSMASAEGSLGSEQKQSIPNPTKETKCSKSKSMPTFLGEESAYVCTFRWDTYQCMSLFCLSVCASICCAPYLKNCTSSDYNFWYKCAKWYLQLLFSFFQNFDFLGV